MATHRPFNFGGSTRMRQLLLRIAQLRSILLLMDDLNAVRATIGRFGLFLWLDKTGMC